MNIKDLKASFKLTEIRAASAFIALVFILVGLIISNYDKMCKSSWEESSTKESTLGVEPGLWICKHKR